MAAKPKPLGKSECVRVIIRCRPMVTKEINEGRISIVKMDRKSGEVSLPKPGTSEPPKVFTFDSVYDQESKQEDLFNETAFPIVENVLIGYNGTIFAYGQTGTGKTFTIEGLDSPPPMLGIMPRAFETIFNSIQGDNTKGKQYLVRASYLELYKEDIRDLLSPNHNQKLELKEKPDSGIYVKDLSSTVVTNVQELREIQFIGRKHRTTAETAMNERSSRSHAIFTITIETSEMGLDNKAHIKVGKLNMVDLAGSERQSKTAAVGERLEEATKINLSLSTLCHVISSLVDAKGGSFIPYRNSKLTRLLQDSLGGNTKTVMIANIGPADYNYDESVSTLRYASRAKYITNKPRINEDPKDAMIRQYQEEIEQLRSDLAKLRDHGGPGSDPSSPGGHEVEAKRSNLIDDKQAKKLMEERSKLESQNAGLLQQKKTVVEENVKLAEEVKKQEEEVKKAAEKECGLLKRLKELEHHLNTVHKAMEQVKKQDLEYQKAAATLEEQRLREKKMREELKKKQEMQDIKEKNYLSQKEKLDDKNKELQKYWTKYQSSKAEMIDLEEEAERERAFMMNQMFELARSIKLYDLIIENFIPEHEKTKIEKSAHWNEETETFTCQMPKFKAIVGKSKRPVSAIGLKRPVSEYGRVVGNPSQNPRFKYENILPLDLDMPERTSEEYEPGKQSTRIQSAFYNILNETHDDFEYHALDNQPILMVPFETQKPIRLVEALTRPQTASARMKGSAGAGAAPPPGSAVPRKKQVGPGQPQAAKKA